MENEKKFIVLIDDSKVVRNRLKVFLKSIGHSFLEAENGIEGLEIVKKYNDEISLLLVDYHMPKLNGLDMIEEIHSSSFGNDVPIILLTSEPPKDFKSLKERINNLKAWMIKPIVERILLSVVKKFIKD